MKIITQLVILTLSLRLVNANYCNKLIKQCSRNFQAKCSYQTVTTESCCDLKVFSAPTRVYKLEKTTFDSANAYCDMTTDGGGWIVILRNKKLSRVGFNNKWADYVKGFGNLATEFWYGLESMHRLTQRGQWEMRVDYQYSNKTWSYLHYGQFSVGNASEEYPLTVEKYKGGAGDSFGIISINGKKFSTPDNDNDDYIGGNCAAINKCGWWFGGCANIDLTKHPPAVLGLPVLFAEMKIRPKGCLTK